MVKKKETRIWNFCITLKNLEYLRKLKKKLGVKHSYFKFSSSLFANAWFDLMRKDPGIEKVVVDQVISFKEKKLVERFKKGGYPKPIAEEMSADIVEGDEK